MSRTDPDAPSAPGEVKPTTRPPVKPLSPDPKSPPNRRK